MNISQHPVTLPALQFRTQIAKVIQQVVVEKKHFQVEKNGLPVMVVIPVENYQHFMELLKTSKPA